jgi:uncharacterized protein
MGNMSHYMLLPAMSCPASCTYCFGPNATSVGSFGRMGAAVLDAAAGWISADGALDGRSVTFHGGEPLNAGLGFYREALPLLSKLGEGTRLEIGLQSNLWLLNEAYCELFKAYQVGLGTSLDGPEEINDAQRGRGYFRKTMAGLSLARQHSLSVGVIATLTAQSGGRWHEVLDFFAGKGLNVSLHAALAPLTTGSEKPLDWVLSPEAFGDVLEAILTVLASPNCDESLKRVRIEPIASACKSIQNGGGGSCTFSPCLGKFYAIVPDGSIYPCQRFAGVEAFRLGNVLEHDGLPKVENSPAWELLSRRQEQVEQDCAGCDFVSLCHGGCVYNALAAGARSSTVGRLDPHCSAYQRLFGGLIERAMDEFFSPENLALVVGEPDVSGSLLRHGPVLSMMRGTGRGG